jgi:hypothetical protein
MAQDFGRVKPLYGRWHWPFRQMEVGDHFYVNYEDRAPEDVRALGGVRAAQLGIRISCRKDDELQAMRVERVPVAQSNERALPKAMDYEQFKGLVTRLYELDADALQWARCIDPGARAWLATPRVGDDPRKLVEVEVAGMSYAVELRGDGVAIERLREGETLQGWQDRRLVAMME